MQKKKEIKEDLRVIRTRKLLCNALFELLETRSFEKLSVIDICDKAMVHRATFYNHFENKEQLLEYAIDELQENLFKKSIENINNFTSKDLFLNLISRTIDFVQLYRDKILLILNQNGYEKAYHLLLVSIKRGVSYLIAKSNYNPNFLIPKEMTVDFFSGGITSIGMSWIQSENPCSKHELLKYFEILVNQKNMEEVIINN